MSHRVSRLVLVAAAALPLAGCFPREIAAGNPLGFFMRLLGGGGLKAKLPVTIVDTTVDVDIVASVGGLSGTYDVTLNDPTGGTFGAFSGTTEIKRGRYIVISDPGSPELMSTVAAIASKALGGDGVTIVTVKGKVSAYQTPGGVDAIFKAKIKFTGIVTSGPNVGAIIKGGKITASGDYPLP